MNVTCTICGTYTTDRAPIGKAFDARALVMCDDCRRKQAPKRGLAEILDEQIRRQYDPAYTSPLFPELATPKEKRR